MLRLAKADIAIRAVTFYPHRDRRSDRSRGRWNLIGIQLPLLARTRRIAKNPFQPALRIALADCPSPLRRDAYSDSGLHRGSAMIRLPHHQRPTNHSHRLHSTAQHLLNLLSFLPQELNLQSVVLSHPFDITLTSVQKSVELDYESKKSRY